MNIQHEPTINVDSVKEHYTKRDGCDVHYVCTTDLSASDLPVNVFYRDTAHPEFGNKYFGLYWCELRETMMIVNADIVEDLDFGLVTDGDEWHYSQSHHDYKTFANGAMVDGGRSYTRASGPVKYMKVRSGKFVKAVFIGNKYVYG